MINSWIRSPVIVLVGKALLSPINGGDYMDDLAIVGIDPYTLSNGARRGDGLKNPTEMIVEEKW